MTSNRVKRRNRRGTEMALGWAIRTAPVTLLSISGAKVTEGEEKIKNRK